MASIIKDFTITTLNEILPEKLNGACCERYGDNIYIFGGQSNTISNNIYKFNCLDKTITKLSVKLPVSKVYAICSSFEDNIYIFGGLGGISDGIYKFNCTTETISTLTTKLPQSLYSSCCARYENNIFIFSGDGDNRLNKIYKFDCLNETITTLSITLPRKISNACCSIYEDNMYIFGGRDGRTRLNTIYKFNITNGVVTKLSTKLPQILTDSSCSIYNNYVFIFGGYNGNSSLNTIHKFNCTNETIETLSITLPQALSSECCSIYNNDIYIFGGYNGNSSLNTIYNFSLILETYNIKYDISSNDGSKKYVELLDNTPINAITFNNVNNTNTVEYIFETLSGTLQGSFEIDEIQNKHLVGFSTIINATSIQIPLNQRVEISISTDTNFYTVYTTYRPLANTFKLELYNNTSEDNRVDKTNYLTKVGELSGVLREESSLVDMSLTLELEELPLFNYVYIAQLNRYYYVTDIVSVKYKLWTISLSVDVLMSYKNALLSCSAFVDRNENSFDNTIIDKKRVIQQGYDIEVSTVTNELLDNTSTNNIVLTGFYVKSV